MAVEMNLGIICGCLNGVKPVLAVVFPHFFGSSHKNPRSRPTYTTYSRATHPNSFAFQPLSDVSAASKSKPPPARGIPIENIGNYDVDGGKDQRNIAWASSTGEVDAGAGVPHNAIAVNQVVTVHGEAKESLDGARSLKSAKSGKGDGGSEEWIMDEFPGPEGIK